MSPLEPMPVIAVESWQRVTLRASPVGPIVFWFVSPCRHWRSRAWARP